MREGGKNSKVDEDSNILHIAYIMSGMVSCLHVFVTDFRGKIFRGYSDDDLFFNVLSVSGSSSLNVCKYEVMGFSKNANINNDDALYAWSVV
jgi:hypothetical protein